MVNESVFRNVSGICIGKVGCVAEETFSGNLYETSQLLTELVPAVTMSFDEGHTQATISPLLCIMASQTKTALSLS